MGGLWTEQKLADLPVLNPIQSTRISRNLALRLVESTASARQHHVTRGQR